MLKATREKFPELNGISMAGIDFTLPEDLTNELNVLIISCYQWQQAIKNMWAQSAADISARYEDFDIYECHLLPEQLSQYESDVRHESQHGINSYTQRQKMISIYTPRDILFKRLKFTNDRQVNVILVSRQGDILWRAEGHPSFEKVLELRGAVHHHVVIERV